ncbi:hypothetical protein [Chitinophaga sp. Ak27]|uniref:hypothetical protein n=1 Tax=Chitinophaga sp. Ak27 TaxID=2726116 RepID=UPI00145F145C|nr:hypothetical protein [Chitinophaga sp. Ak27]NLU96473.1 hypothetical protein [Chitinophaga sp. Ak27]
MERRSIKLRNRMAKPAGLSPHTGCEAAGIISPNWWQRRLFNLRKRVAELHVSYSVLSA